MGGFEPIGLQGFECGIEQLQVRYAKARVEWELSGAVEARGRGRKYFANPVGRYGEERLAWRFWHSFPTPTCDVRHNKVLVHMQLGLIQDPPPTGAAVTKLHARDERRTKG